MHPAASNSLISNFWSAAVAHPGFEQPLDTWREMIFANQMPAQCSTMCSLKGNVHWAGAMQNRRRLAFALIQAVLKGCTMIGGIWPSERTSPLNTGLTLRDWCTRQNRLFDECYFLPVSNCSWAPGKSVQYLIELNDLSAALERVANLTGLRSELLVMGTAMSWLMRPQSELREAVEHYGKVLGLAQSGARHRRVAMHIRRGDKYSLHPKHLGNHSWRIHPASFVTWGRRVSAIVGAERVLYMSDDEELNLTHRGGSLFQLAPAPRRCVPSGVDKLNSGRFKNGMKMKAQDAFRQLIAHPEIWASRKRTAERLQWVLPQLDECGSEMWADDGIYFYAGVLLMAQCATFIGLQISNVGMAVAELMATQRHPPVVYDVLNDVYRGPYNSDERVRINGVHHPNSLRPIAFDRLANGDGTASHGCWACDGDRDKDLLRKLPPELEREGRLRPGEALEGFGV
jgi:hypothetical protein